MSSHLKTFKLLYMDADMAITDLAGAAVLMPHPASAHLFKDRVKVSSSATVPLPGAPSAFSQRNVLHLLGQGPAVGPAHDSINSILGALIAWESAWTLASLQNVSQGKLGVFGPLDVNPGKVNGRQYLLVRREAGGDAASPSCSPSSRLLLAEDLQNIQLRCPALGFDEEPPGPEEPVHRRAAMSAHASHAIA